MKLIRSNSNARDTKKAKQDNHVQKIKGQGQHKKIALFLLTSAFVSVSDFHSPFVSFCEAAEEVITLNTVTTELGSIVESLSSQPNVKAKANQIMGILQKIFENKNDEKSKLSSYRLSRIHNILTEDKYNDVDYSVKALITQGAWGYEDSPIGMATVQSRLNEIADLIVRSLILDELGNSTDEQQQNSGTIWSRLNYLIGHATEADKTLLGSVENLSLTTRDPSALPLAPFLNFIRNQLTGMAPLLDETSLWTIFGCVSNLKEKLNDAEYAEFRKSLTSIYTTLVGKAKGILPASMPEYGWYTYATPPKVVTYSLANRYEKTQGLVSGLEGDSLVDLSRIVRVSGYLWPRLLDEINALASSTGEASDRIQQECRISIGTLTQPGLTLMNCLTEICQVIFAAKIEGIPDNDNEGIPDNDKNFREIVKNSPFLGLLETESRLLFESENLNKAALHSSIKVMASGQTEEPFKSFFDGSSGLEEDASYDYADLVECILYSDSLEDSEVPDAYEELYAVPLLNKLPQPSSNSPWFLLGDADKSQAIEQYVPYILKNIAPFLAEKISNQTDQTDQTLYTAVKNKIGQSVEYAVLDPVFQLVEQYKNTLAETEQNQPCWDALSQAKTKSHPVNLLKILQKSKSAAERSLDCSKKESDLAKYSNCKADVEKFAVLSKNVEDAYDLYNAESSAIKADLVKAQCTELVSLNIIDSLPEAEALADALKAYKTQVALYLEKVKGMQLKLAGEQQALPSKLDDLEDVKTGFHAAEKTLLSAIYTTESELDFFRGSDLDHPADITLYGLLNGILFECGAQLLLNYVGTACDAGDSNGTLYAKILALETDAFVDSLGDSNKLNSIEDNANLMRSSLSDLVGTIRYKYKDVMYGDITSGEATSGTLFATVLRTLEELRAGTGWPTKENLLTVGGVNNFCTAIESLIANLLGENR